MCKNSVVTPFERPAAAVINWADLGVRIGDRSPDDQLAAATLRRIKRGLEMFGRPALVNSAHSDDRAYPVEGAPFPSRTTKIGDGLACPPFLDANGGSWNRDPARVDQPFRTRTATEWEGLVVPPGAFYVKNYSGRPEDRVRAVAEPFGAMTTSRNHSIVVPPGAFVETKRNNVLPTSAWEPLTTVSAQGNHHGLVVPYYRTGVASPTRHPFPTMTTRDTCGLAVDSVGELDVMACHYRMVQWYEQARAQRFPTSYRITGNNGERTAQAGNAVSSNVAQWIGEQCAEVLNRTVAA